MTLKSEDRNNIITYRKERAYSTFKEAQFNAKGEFWNLVVNRLYYSVFYICEALLLSKQIPVNTHAGVNRMMGYHFVRTGLLTIEEGKLLGKLFRMRQTGDYDDLFDWKKEEILPLFDQTEALINKIESLIDPTITNETI